MKFNINQCLRSRLLTRIGSVAVTSRCQLRGRPSQLTATDQTSNVRPEHRHESDDHELLLSNSSLKHQMKTKFQYRDVYDRARHDFNERYSDDHGRDDFNYRNNYHKKGKFQDRRNQEYFDDYRQRSKQHYDGRDKYMDRKSTRDYNNFKKKSYFNEFNESEDNAIYREDRSYPKSFSRKSEQSYSWTKKAGRMSNVNEELDKYDNVNQDRNDESDGKPGETKQKIAIPYSVTQENRFEVLNQIVVPLHLKPYDTQLKIKYHQSSDVLRKLGAKLKRMNSGLIRDSSGLPCPLEPVKPSPQTDRYRNKDEFSIWPGVDGFSKTLGFFIGQPSIHHNVVCVEPYQIIVSKQSHLSIAKKFQTYLKEVTEYDSCQNYGEGGNWRRFHIRSNHEGHHMITAIMHPQELSQQELDDEMNRYRDYFIGDPQIKSIYFQSCRHTRMSNEKAPYNHLFGDKTITETLFDKKFEISVDSFFQINSRAAEVLYRNIINEVNPSRNTTVLDICCGTGTLATIMASDVCRVIGIDSSQSAINDAEKNAKINGINNTKFIVGSVENVLPKLVDDLYAEDIVVVANPSRGGLHSSVINLIREMSSIRKLVYISCKPEGNAFKNFLHLCMPSNRESRHLGPAFLPINAIPVDMFPHTNHCELIITFERF